MAYKLSFWERSLRMLMPKKAYVLRRMRIETEMLESRVASFTAEVSNAELSIINILEDLRNLEARQIEAEERHLLVSVKIEGVGEEFQRLQDRKKVAEAAVKSNILVELIDEQVNLEKTISENGIRIKKQTGTMRELRKSLNGMKHKLSQVTDTKDDLLSRYKTVQAMDRADATLALLESGSHEEIVQSIEQHVRTREALSQGRKEVRSLSTEQQFKDLEHEMAVAEKLEQYTKPMKGIK